MHFDSQGKTSKAAPPKKDKIEAAQLQEYISHERFIAFWVLFHNGPLDDPWYSKLIDGVGLAGFETPVSLFNKEHVDAAWFVFFKDFLNEQIKHGMCFEAAGGALSHASTEAYLFSITDMYMEYLNIYLFIFDSYNVQHYLNINLIFFAFD